MGALESNKDNYSIYCREHLGEFRNQLREDANRFMVTWPARTLVILLLLASFTTYVTQDQQENPFAIYTLLTYLPAISLVAVYPFLTLLISTLEKYSPQVVDLLCLFTLLGFTLTLYFIFLGAPNLAVLEENFLLLQGQMAFALAGTTAFSFYGSFRVIVIRNLCFTIVVSTILYFVNTRFLSLNVLLIPEGFFVGTMMNWMFYDGARTRFYLKSTDADTRQHLYNQLSKLVYPHQLERIKLGDELENTMPLKEGKAIINVFDVQRSSEIRHERTQDFFMGVFQAFLQICMKGYEHNPLRSRAFRLKETGDGFISSVGYPFLPVDSRSLADSAVATAFDMFEAFNLEVEKFNYSRPIKGAMGLAYNSVQGTFQSGGIRSYDLFGEALIQASKYEEIRKQANVWELFTRKAKEQGLDNFNIIILQEVVYNSLSPSYRDLFAEIELANTEFVDSNFQMMYDNEAKYLYYHLLP